jgi:hypothetical protein
MVENRYRSAHPAQNSTGGCNAFLSFNNAAEFCQQKNGFIVMREIAGGNKTAFAAVQSTLRDPAST